jgi:hypothetical protein
MSRVVAEPSEIRPRRVAPSREEALKREAPVTSFGAGAVLAGAFWWSERRPAWKSNEPKKAHDAKKADDRQLDRQLDEHALRDPGGGESAASNVRARHHFFQVTAAERCVKQLPHRVVDFRSRSDQAPGCDEVGAATQRARTLGRPSIHCGARTPFGGTVASMRALRSLRSLAIVLCGSLAFFTLASCSSNSGTGGGTLTPPLDGGADSSGGDDGGDDGATNDTGGLQVDTAVPDVPVDAAPPLMIYAHTDTTLYQMSPTTLDVTKVGDFDCVPSDTSTMTDVAVDGALNVWSVSAKAVWQLQISGGVAHCAKKVPLATAGAVFYALTFAPAGVIDPTKEVLIAGNTAGELWSIDGTTGTATLRGNFGTVPANDGNGHTYAANRVGKPWELSGDIVFLSNGGNPVGFATVRDCDDPPNPPTAAAPCNLTDTLIEIDLAKLKGATPGNVTKSVRGQLIRGASCGGGTWGYGSVFGIAAWNDKIYGFSKSGDLLSIDNDTAATCLVKSFGTEKWDGAGVTTNAPVIVPPPR